jgi:hypothetical protein
MLVEIGEVLVEDVEDGEDVEVVEGATFHPFISIASMFVAFVISSVVENHDEFKAVYEITCPDDSEDRHFPVALPGWPPTRS